MTYEHKKTIIKQLAEKILNEGLRVFIAEKGTYGIMTNAEGSRVVSFDVGLDGVSFAGCYKTANPRRTGSGWQIVVDSSDGNIDFHAILNAAAPRWAVGDVIFTYTTLDQHLAVYQDSSHYQEVLKNG